VKELVVDDRERDFAGVTDSIAVEIGLTRVGQLRTVVGVIGNAIAVGIGSRGRRVTVEECKRSGTEECRAPVSGAIGSQEGFLVFLEVAAAMP